MDRKFVTTETYEFLVLTTVGNADVGLAALVEDSEGEVLDVGLHLSIEDGVMGVPRDLVLGRITDQMLGVGEGDIGRGWWGFPGHWR